MDDEPYLFSDIPACVHVYTKYPSKSELKEIYRKPRYTRKSRIDLRVQLRDPFYPKHYACYSDVCKAPSDRGFIPRLSKTKVCEICGGICLD